MLNTVQGIHHITSMARDAARTDRFLTEVLGLRRVKKTVNFDAPEVYHLYYANRTGQPGTVMTYFPFPGIVPGKRGAGEVSITAFSIPQGSLGFWQERFEENNVTGIRAVEMFGEKRLHFEGSNGDGFALVEMQDTRAPWTGAGIGEESAIRGFHSASMLLRELETTRALLELMGFTVYGDEDRTVRMVRSGGNGADIIDLTIDPDAPPARQGAGSVHHIAFAVPNAEAQLEARRILADEGYAITPVIDRDYFLSIYFRTPGGVLFEIATNEPGFARDEDVDHLGEALKLPQQHAHLREHLETHLPPLDG